MTERLRIHPLMGLFRKPSFWLIVISLALISIPHYVTALEHPDFISRLYSALGLDRDSFERILFLAPIVWGGLFFGRTGAITTSLVAVGLMLPHAAASTAPLGNSLEVAAVYVVGNVLALTFAALRSERERRTQLEATQGKLRQSEERYRSIYENALDAIWLHDLDGNITAANLSSEKLTGYSVKELPRMNVRTFLSEESLHTASQVRAKLLAREPVEQPYEQQLTRKDGSVAIIQLVTSLVFESGRPVAFQHIARDVTEQKRLQDNLRFYTQQATRAQEEERKRISRELHDDTIQALVVISRQLDILASSGKDLTGESRERLKQIWEQTNSIMDEMRRLGRDLRPTSLDHLGLLPALEWLASDLSDSSQIMTTVNLVGKPRRLSEEAELVLYRIAEEALRNVQRHSQAVEAEIKVEFDAGVTRVTVSDNGKGSNLPGTISDLVRDGKLGLVAMQERALSVGGTLTIKSQPGSGTSITIELPG